MRCYYCRVDWQYQKLKKVDIKKGILLFLYHKCCSNSCFQTGSEPTILLEMLTILLKQLLWGLCYCDSSFSNKIVSQQSTTEVTFFFFLLQNNLLILFFFFLARIPAGRPAKHSIVKHKKRIFVKHSSSSDSKWSPSNDSFGEKLPLNTWRF